MSFFRLSRRRASCLVVAESMAKVGQLSQLTGGGGVWCVICGVWCVVRGVWCVVRGAWCVAPTADANKQPKQVRLTTAVSTRRYLQHKDNAYVQYRMNHARYRMRTI